MVSSAVHNTVPTVEATKKRLNRILSRPAGIETRLRTVGTSRPSITKVVPLVPNQRSARSTSGQLSVSQRPQRSMNGRRRMIPSARAARYQNRLPSIAPAVPAAITGPIASLPCATAIPATGMMTSDGIGGNTVSRNIRKPMPR